MSTILDVAVRALSTDFPSSETANAKRYIRQAIGLIFTETALGRGQVITSYDLDAGSFFCGPFGGASAVASLRPTTVFLADYGEPLTPVSYDEIGPLNLSGRMRRGRPAYYSFGGDSSLVSEPNFLHFDCYADKDYLLYAIGQRVPGSTDLDDGDDLPLDERWEDLPRYYARAELFADVEDDEKMHDFWMTKFETGCRRLRADLQRRPGRHRQVPGTWSNLTPGAGPTFRHPQGLF